MNKLKVIRYFKSFITIRGFYLNKNLVMSCFGGGNVRLSYLILTSVHKLSKCER